MLILIITDMESTAAFDFGDGNELTTRSSDATRELARKHGGVIPPESDQTGRYFQPRFVTRDPPPNALLYSYEESQSKAASSTDMATGGETSSKAVEMDSSKNTERTVPSGSDDGSEEMRLMSASDSFDNQIGQYRPVSRMAHSSRPVPYRYGANTSYTRAQNADAYRRFHESFSTSHSGPVAPYQGGQSNDVRLSTEDDSYQASREIANRISMLSTFLGRSPGIAGDHTSHTKLLTEISQIVTSAICNLRFERDNARRDADRVSHRAFRDNATFRTDNRRLQEDVKKILNREKNLKRELEMEHSRLNAMKYDLENTEKEALNFRDHHAQIRVEFKKSEETQRLHIQSLEGEIKRLRIRNAQLAKSAGQEVEDDSIQRPEFSPPSAPESHKADAPSESTENHDFLWGMLKKKSDEQSKRSKSENYGNKKFANSPQSAAAGPSVRRKDSSSFNPEAPSFQPPLSSKNLAAVSDMGPAPSPIGGPSNWPALLSHNGKTPATGRSDLKPTTVVHSPLESGEKRHSGITRFNNEAWTIQDIDQALTRLTLLTKGYIVRCHKHGEPTKVSHKMLSRKEETTWKYVVNLVFTNNVFQAESHMTNLLSILAYRSCLIMRIIQDYLFRKVISPSIFLGFNEKLDQHLAALQDRIAQFSHPDYVCNVRDRQAVLKDHAKIVDEALKTPGMKEFKTETINRHTQILTGILHPLRAVDVTDRDAHAGIRTIVTLGWDMSTKIWTSGMMLSYFFPQCGVLFSESTMKAVNLDAYHVGTQKELQLMQAVVSFVVTPSLSVRDDRDGVNNGVHGLRKAEIIAMD
ncbi:uncharacterized protein GGS22DRAFT_200365 [Annulohypoxylon maeteangense]|uniref:uncharacterized protein n=1 Tax=Annulohypoxylon maeteangense TaxID=1927788 RepID=UPI002007ED87|nr:uncharacterized protein GGS22DRAFT_200365 [Annulohypoxylon maeteangense]KAI0884619.1 hypothetical protein GGS22DRAFT_200365 [Annulohypoxylon maeteangense]